MQQFSLCFARVKKDCLKFIKSQETKADKFKNKERMIKSFLIPLCFWISKKANKKRPYFVGLAGGQGTGKTTISSLIRIILIKYFKLKVFRISIDDFYKTRKERISLSKKVHPMLLTRGVPGTHDINLLNKTIKKLKKKNFKPVLIPRFDKSVDDRHKKIKWIKIKKPPKIIIFEGWCVGAKYQRETTLIKPLNLIESKHDAELKWRKKVNYYLKKNYKKLFNSLDKLIYLKAPSFNYIFKWRLLQEKKLKLTSNNKNTMSKSNIREFIMFYERITKQMMKDFNIISDLTIFLDKNHRSTKMKFF